MNELIKLFQNSENWLIKRVLYYSKTLGYNKYFSTLEKSLPQSIKELTTLLIGGLKNFKEIPHLTPDEDLGKNSLTSFGIKEVSKHKIRGIALAHFLGLFKYYKQSYIDLITANYSVPQIDKIRLFIERSFDRIEIGICREWTKPDNDEYISELRSMNRLLTNEKNNYLTMFARLAEPAIMINKNHEILNLNDAAVKIIDAEQLSESQSFHNHKQYSQDENDTRHFLSGKQIFDVFPWLTVPLKKLQK